jgi:hypothetical protein
VAQQAFQLGEHFREQVFAAQIGNGALLDLAVVAIGFDNADVLVNLGCAVSGGFYAKTAAPQPNFLVFS